MVDCVQTVLRNFQEGFPGRGYDITTPPDDVFNHFYHCSFVRPYQICYISDFANQVLHEFRTVQNKAHQNVIFFFKKPDISLTVVSKETQQQKKYKIMRVIMTIRKE